MLWMTDFPGSPVVKTLCPHHKGCRFTLVGELRSRMPCVTAKKFKKNF